MPRQEVQTDVPEADLAQLVGDFESEGATVTKEKQLDGSWKVVATFPDKPPANRAKETKAKPEAQPAIEPSATRAKP
jgi:hypothetical protein